ncbi:AgmX/PglI C-terminal domain-containing protein [candidate division KSB1 bacterium]|nr:AgmX/PglI C-terminal domain-containing protein [candidate division KSB1 bacterium]
MEHWSDTTPLQKAAPAAKDSESTGLAEHQKVSSRENADSHETMPDEFGPDGVLPPYHPPLQAFPKEFNKNYFETLDRRYWMILLVTLLLEPLLIWYLIRTHPLGITEKEIAKLQNKYAELFLSEFKVEDPQEEEKAHNELLLRAAEAIPQIVGEATGMEPSINLPRVRPNASPEARALPGEQRQAWRRINTAARQRGMQALSEHVERIGLLGVITSGSGIISRAPVTDILEFADSTAGDIEYALAQVKALRIPRAGVDYFGTNVGTDADSRSDGSFFGNQVHIAAKELRGKRATSSGIMPEDIVTGLAAAPQKKVERNSAFERVASAPALVPPTPGISGLRMRPTNGHATRERDKIRDLVAAHNPAIQDCYRKQLKGDTALKGKVTVRFTVNPLGHVVDAQVVKSAMTSGTEPVTLPELEACILNKIRNWRDFGQVDESTGEVTYRQTYVFGY